MKITWKHALLSLLLGILTFILMIELEHPYRSYVGIPSIVLIFSSFVLLFTSEMQRTTVSWRKFKVLKEDKDFVNYIETEFEKINFNFNFKTQMVLGNKVINIRIEEWDKLKKEIDKC